MTPKLGDAWQVTLGVKDLETSLRFYERLGFQAVGRNAQPWPWAQLTDGCILVTLNQQGQVYGGLTYFAADMPKRAEHFTKLGAPIRPMDFGVGSMYQGMFTDPDGFGVSLIEYDAEKMHNPGGKPLSRCGQLAELSLEVKDFDRSVAFWKLLGFSLHMFKEGARWGKLSDGMVNLGVYESGTCPHKLTQPSLCYFGQDMDERLSGLQKDGFAFVYQFPPNAKGLVHSAIVESPDGHFVLLFTD